MEDELEKAARKHQNHFPTYDSDSTMSAYENGKHAESYRSFMVGAEWMKANYNKAQKCPVCEGKGYINVGGSYSIATTVCPTCKGNRIIYIK